MAGRELKEIHGRDLYSLRRRSSLLRLNEMCSSMVKLWIPETVKSFVVDRNLYCR